MIRFADVYTLKAYGQLRKLMFNLFQDEESLATSTFMGFLIWGIFWLNVFHKRMTIKEANDMVRVRKVQQDNYWYIFYSLIVILSVSFFTIMYYMGAVNSHFGDISG
jgi:hypothetical protein